MDQHRASPQQPLHLPTPTAPQRRDVYDLLYTNPADGRTLTTLSKEVGASERTLSRLFRADLGMTFPIGVLSCACTTPWSCWSRTPRSPLWRTAAAGRPPARSSTSSAGPSDTLRGRIGVV